MMLSEDPDFAASALMRSFEATPLHFIDIGARGGIQDFVQPVANLTAILAFEPDADAAAELRNAPQAGWKRLAVENAAVGGHNGTAQLNLYAHGVNHSLLKASDAFRERYRVKSLEDRGSIEIAVRTLDDVLFGSRAGEPHWGEFLKLDVQGAELDILQGARRTLDERTVAIVSEVSFTELYRDQPRFSDIERYLASCGFTFYGFKYVQGWSQKFIDKKSARGSERLCFGDAIFLRDPFPSAEGGPRVLSRRQYQVLYLCALLFRYYDFAVELVAAYEKDEAEARRLFAVIERQAAHSPQAALKEVEDLLSRMKHEPDKANLELLKFIEAHRQDFDASDAALPRRPWTLDDR
jgi:FkbM family methyltransferase